MPVHEGRMRALVRRHTARHVLTCVIATAAAVQMYGTEARGAKAQPALAGKWHLRFSQLRAVNIIRHTDHTRTWIFKRACAKGACKQRLLFELTSGGYEK